MQPMGHPSIEIIRRRQCRRVGGGQGGDLFWPPMKGVTRTDIGRIIKVCHGRIVGTNGIIIIAANSRHVLVLHIHISSPGRINDYNCANQVWTPTKYFSGWITVAISVKDLKGAWPVGSRQDHRRVSLIYPGKVGV